MGKLKLEKKNSKRKQGGLAGGGVQKQGIRFNKDFGQHILKNPLIVQNMVEKVAV
jgi:18S rRNA (adenine1779-N6/adenine1780-N6)-dimethyltransferase